MTVKETGRAPHEPMRLVFASAGWIGFGMGVAPATVWHDLAPCPPFAYR
jgi:hypothetical protein